MSFIVNQHITHFSNSCDVSFTKYALFFRSLTSVQHHNSVLLSSLIFFSFALKLVLIGLWIGIGSSIMFLCRNSIFPPFTTFLISIMIYSPLVFLQDTKTSTRLKYSPSSPASCALLFSVTGTRATKLYAFCVRHRWEITARLLDME